MDESERGAAAVTESRQRRRTTGDDGAAVVEMALVGSLLFLLIFAIIAFGYAMSIRQNMTQAAAEGARAAVVTTNPITAKTVAQAATTSAVSAFGKSCNTNGMSCTFFTAPCSAMPQPPAAPLNQDIAPNGSKHCIQVFLRYTPAQDSKDSFLDSMPLVGQFLPNDYEARSVIEVAP